MRQRVDTILSMDLPTEQLPALASMLALTQPAFLERLRKVQSGTFKKQQRPPKHPERVIRVQHPGLWRQL
jgi:hypothetical protein